MLSLPEQQMAFGAALLAGGDRAFFAHFVEVPALAEKRFAAYRRNVLGNWRAALAASYPVLTTLVGRRRFRQLAEQYLNQYPSRDGDLNRYGDSFPAGIATDPIAAELPYLHDLARLEWALEVAYGAADDGRLDFARLNAIPAERQGQVQLVLAASLQALTVGWPVTEIWQAHQAGSEDRRDAALAAITLEAQEHLVIVARNAVGTPLPWRLGSGEAAFFTACRQHCSLTTALGRAVNCDPGLDVSTLLPDWLARGWIVDVRLPAGVTSCGVAS